MLLCQSFTIELPDHVHLMVACNTINVPLLIGIRAGEVLN